MCMMNTDGLSTLDNGFLAGKFSGAIRRHKKTVAAIKFDGIRMNRTGKPSRKRAAVERQIVQELNFDLRNWSVEMMLVAGDQKMIEAELAGAFDNDQDDSCMDDECPDCGRYSCQCDSYDGHYDGHYDSFYDADDFYYTPRMYAFTHQPVLMTEEEKMKLSDELWLDHEFFFGRNNLRTMTRSFGDEHYQLVDNNYDYGFDEFGACDEEPVDEFGGLPNQLDFSLNYRNDGYKSDDELFEQHYQQLYYEMLSRETDFTFKPNPRKVRRAARFSEIPGTVTYLDQTGFVVTVGKVKRVGRHGYTCSYNLLSRRCEDKDIERMKDKTAEKRAHKRLLNEVFGVEPKTGQKLRFKSMDEKEQYEAQQRKAAEREARATNAADGNNVDYSLAHRRMVTREVLVTRTVNINGRKKSITSLEPMQCRC